VIGRRLAADADPGTVAAAAMSAGAAT